jgi:hypothetical protein
MIAVPTPEEIAALKVECRKRFGHERIVGVSLGAPFDVLVAVAALDLASATEYDDARGKSAENARSALLFDRCLWPSQERLDAIREAPDTCAIDGLVEQKFRAAMGFDGDDEPAFARLSTMSAPPAFASSKEAAAKIAALAQANPGVPLWSVSHRSSGLACILRQPIADVWTAISHTIGEAMKSRKGVLSAVTPFARDLCVWVPGLAPGGSAGAALAAHLDEAPGRAMHLVAPIVAMGGAFAEARASFL